MTILYKVQREKNVAWCIKSEFVLLGNSEPLQRYITHQVCRHWYTWKSASIRKPTLKYFLSLPTLQNKSAYTSCHICNSAWTSWTIYNISRMCYCKPEGVILKQYSCFQKNIHVSHDHTRQEMKRIQSSILTISNWKKFHGVSNLNLG